MEFLAVLVDVENNISSGKVIITGVVSVIKEQCNIFLLKLSSLSIKLYYNLRVHFSWIIARFARMFLVL